MIGLRYDKNRESKLNPKEESGQKDEQLFTFISSCLPYLGSILWHNFALGSCSCVVVDVCLCGPKSTFPKNHMDLMTIALYDACV